MINHAAILLLNSQQNKYTGLPNVIFIPPSFKPLALTGVLQRVHDTLFPAGISPEIELDIVRAILPFVHQPDMQLFLDEWDARRTYETGTLTPNDLIKPPVTIGKQIYGTCDVTPVYRWEMTQTDISVGSAGIFNWTFTYVDPVVAKLRNQSGAVSQITMVDSTTSQSTKEVTLVPERLHAYFLIPSRVLTPHFVFTYAINLAPTYYMSAVMNQVFALLNDHHDRVELFEPFNPLTSELQVMRYTFESSPEISLRFGAVLMAYIYQASRRAFFTGAYSGTAS